MTKSAVVCVAVVVSALIGAKNIQAEEHEHKHDEGKQVTVKGEVLDMACYLDHGASGTKHADCAKTCIESGLPVGIKADDGRTYLLIGEHEPINKKLADYAGKTITVKGKAVSRDGINMIANAEIVSK